MREKESEREENKVKIKKKPTGNNQFRLIRFTDFFCSFVKVLRATFTEVTSHINFLRSKQEKETAKNCFENFRKFH